MQLVFSAEMVGRLLYDTEYLGVFSSLIHTHDASSHSCCLEQVESVLHTWYVAFYMLATFSASLVLSSTALLVEEV